MTTDQFLDFVRDRLYENAEGVISAADVVNDILEALEQIDDIQDDSVR